MRSSLVHMTPLDTSRVTWYHVRRVLPRDSLTSEWFLFPQGSPRLGESIQNVLEGSTRIRLLREQGCRK